MKWTSWTGEHHISHDYTIAPPASDRFRGISSRQFNLAYVSDKRAINLKISGVSIYVSTARFIIAASRERDFLNRRLRKITQDLTPLMVDESLGVGGLKKKPHFKSNENSLSLELIPKARNLSRDWNVRIREHEERKAFFHQHPLASSAFVTKSTACRESIAVDR